MIFFAMIPSVLSLLNNWDSQATLALNYFVTHWVWDSVHILLSDKVMWLVIYALGVSLAVYLMGWRRALPRIIMIGMCAVLTAVISDVALKRNIQRLRPCAPVELFIPQSEENSSFVGAVVRFLMPATLVTPSSPSQMILPVHNPVGCHSQWGMPSNHASWAASIAVSIFWLISLGGGRAFVWCFFLIGAVLIGLSRVFLGVHYLGDVLAGWALGALSATVLMVLLLKIPWVTQVFLAGVLSRS